MNMKTLTNLVVVQGRVCLLESWMVLLAIENKGIGRTRKFATQILTFACNDLIGSKDPTKLM